MVTMGDKAGEGGGASTTPAPGIALATTGRHFLKHVLLDISALLDGDLEVAQYFFPGMEVRNPLQPSRPLIKPGSSCCQNAMRMRPCASFVDS